MKKIPPVHPGEILWEEFMQPLGISQNALGRALHVPVPRIHAIVKQQRGITADTALRLGQYFNTSPQFWLNLQNRYELELASDRLNLDLEKDIPPLPRI